MSALKDRPQARSEENHVTVHLQGTMPDDLRRTLEQTTFRSDELINLLRASIASRTLAPAMEASPLPATPQMARSLQARENWLRSIDEEFGTFSRQDVAELRGSTRPNRNMAADLQEKGKIIAYRRGNSYRIPAFQFTDTGQVRPAMPKLIAAAADAGWDTQDLLAWLTNYNRNLPGNKRPVDCLDDADRVIELLEATVEEQLA